MWDESGIFTRIICRLRLNPHKMNAPPVPDYSEDRVTTIRCSDGKDRTMRIWEPDQPKAVFLIVHGALDHSGNYASPAVYFRDHGIASLAYNQQGHDHKGPDHPRRVHVSRFGAFLDDLDLALEKTLHLYPGVPVFVLAHSMGGLIATHYGIRRLKDHPLVRGFVLSSPYYVNAVKAPAVVLRLAGLLSAVLPKIKAPIEDIFRYVTHDDAIYQRHRSEQREGIKASEVSLRFGHELLRAQAWIPGHISEWQHPVMFIVAGDDRLADAGSTRELAGLIDGELVELLYYPDNYHENFNELNRNEIFGRILKWVEARLKG